MAAHLRRRRTSRPGTGSPKRALKVLALEALEPRTLLDSSGPRIISSTPTEVRNAAFDHLDVTFNEAIDPETFSTQDVAITGSVGPIAVTGIAPAGGNTYRIAFPPQT